MRDGKAVPLTPKVYEVLQLLVQNSGHMLGKEELLKAVWPDSFVEEGNLTRNISTLRAALGEPSDGHRYIETVPKRGYRFVAEVTEFDQGAELIVKNKISERIFLDEDEQQSNHGSIANVAPPARDPGGHLSETIKQRLGIATLAAVILGLTVPALVYFTRTGEAIDSVAVLPFVNMSSDPDTEYLSAGISDSIISSLSNLPNLKVVNLNSDLRYKGKQTDPQVIGRDFNCRAVLMGRFSQRGDDLLISTELVDVRDHRVLWAEKYNRKRADIIAVQEDLSQEISERLRLRLSGEEKKQLSKRYTEKPEAYEAYLHGRFFFDSGTDAGQKTAIDYFEQAIKIDPAFAPAYVGLARLYRKSGNYSYLSPKEARQKGESVLRKALEIDDTLAEAHAMLAAIKQDEGDWPGAEQEFGRARELNSRAWGVHGLYARYLVAIGRNDEAVTEARRALEIDPLSSSALGGIAWVSLQARQYDQAIEFFRKAIEMDPTDPRFHNNLARALVQKRVYKEAIIEFQKGIALDNSAPGRSAHLAYTFAVLGQKAEAWKVLDELKKRAEQGNVAPVHFAIIYAGLGEKDQAFAWLEKHFKDRSGPPYIQIDPVLDSLRSDPRFADLARRKGLAT